LSAGDYFIHVEVTIGSHTYSGNSSTFTINWQWQSCSALNHESAEHDCRYSKREAGEFAR
jgi:hypothetical protein